GDLKTGPQGGGAEHRRAEVVAANPAAKLCLARIHSALMAPLLAAEGQGRPGPGGHPARSGLADGGVSAGGGWGQVRARRSWTMSVAAVGVPLTNPKKGPKSRVAVNPGRYRPARLVPNASSSTGKPSFPWIRPMTPAREGLRA